MQGHIHREKKSEVKLRLVEWGVIKSVGGGVGGAETRRHRQEKRDQAVVGWQY